MSERWIVFGGWGIPPEILAPLFNDDAVLIDSTVLAAALVRNNALITDWEDTLATMVLPHVAGTPFYLAGWSTGAIMAWSFARMHPPRGAVLLSATPSFCRRPGFPQGQHPSMLRAMRRRIAERVDMVLEEFCGECGVPYCPTPAVQTKIPELTGGLRFLEEASLFPLDKAAIPTLFLHGRNDTIIPIDAGRYFSAQTGGDFHEYDGPHAFFVDRIVDVRDRIRHFIKDGDR